MVRVEVIKKAVLAARLAYIYKELGKGALFLEAGWLLLLVLGSTTIMNSREAKCPLESS